MRQPHRTDVTDRGGDRYAYAAKALVRAHLIPYFGARSPIGFPSRALVWCFPGSSSAEVNAYLAAGVPISGIRGFEWNPSVARGIRARHPQLTLYEGSLGNFLTSRSARDATCDWANLDFDGATLSFPGEIAGVIARLRMEAPRFAFTSFASRNRTVLIESLIAATALRVIAPGIFNVGVDLRLLLNEHGGLIVRDAAAWYAVARELAILLEIVRSFGARAYNDRDTAAAKRFRNSWRRAYDQFRIDARPAVRTTLLTHRDLPDVDGTELRALIDSRSIPMRCDDGIRFAYRTANHQWMWTWMFRFSGTRGMLVPLAEWIEKLVAGVPPLHVVDHTGRLVRGNEHGVCPHCAQARVALARPPAALVPKPATPALPSNSGGGNAYTFLGDEHIVPTIGDRMRADAARMSRDAVYAKWVRQGFTKRQIASALAWRSDILQARRHSTP